MPSNRSAEDYSAAKFFLVFLGGMAWASVLWWALLTALHY